VAGVGARPQGAGAALLDCARGLWYKCWGTMGAAMRDLSIAIASIIIIRPAVSRERCWSDTG